MFMMQPVGGGGDETMETIGIKVLITDQICHMKTLNNNNNHHKNKNKKQNQQS